MKEICIMEPLAVAPEVIDELSQNAKAAGYTITAYDTKETDQAKLLERVKEATIIILANQPLSGDIIRACKNLKMLSVAFTGVDHIDLAACKERGIAVCNAAGYATNAVAELVFGLAIGVYRNILPCDERTREGSTKAGLEGFELFGKTFGVVGLGAIGMRVAEIAKAFGCKVLGYNRSHKDHLEGIEQVSLDELLERSDIVSLNVPLTAETKGLIGERELNMMKHTAIVINTARGPVVDIPALAKALHEGTIAGAGIDVFEMEPPIPTDHPLCHTPHTVLAPHIGFASHEAFVMRAGIVFDNVNAFLDGKLINSVFKD